MDFSRRSRAPNSAVLGPIGPNYELARDAIYILDIFKYKEDPIKMSVHNIFPITTLLELSITMETRVPIRSGLKPHSLSSNPLMLQMKFGCDRPAGYGDIVYTHTQTDTHTYAGLTPILYAHLVSLRLRSAEKHQTLEILLRVEFFMHFLKKSHFFKIFEIH